MIRKFLPLLLLLASTAYGVETLTVNSKTRDVINLGAFNFATSQLKVNGVAVVGGGGGGGGGGGTGTIDNVRLILPTALFVSPVDYTISGGLAEGTANLAPQDSGTVFANLTGSTAAPIFVTLSALKTSLSINNVSNTSDANKPISDATQAALDTLTTASDTNTSDIAALTTTVSGKANSSTVTSALALKADITYVDTQDDTKQDSWGLPAFNGYIAAGDTDGSLHWVDPVTLGTTSQTFTDGVENSSTTLTSATANFVAGDVGKTITGDNIPGATTIASRTNSTTVVLSAAATATGSGNTFTIINRLEVGGTGTVTNFSSGNLSPLFTTSVGSGSSTPNQTFSLSNAAANTFFGNGTALSAAPTFMDAATARTALGGTTVGQAMFSLANPSLIRFLRINSDNTVSALDNVTFRNAIGAGTVTNLTTVNNIPTLFGVSVTSGATTPAMIFDPVNAAANTFYGNSTGSAATPTFMTAPTARTSLGGTTVGQNLFTLANPSAVTYPRISATNSVTAATGPTVLSDIGGAATSDTRFPANVTGIRKSAGLASTDTAATVNVDYAKNNQATVNATSQAWPSGIIVWRQSAPLAATTVTGNLPAANTFAPGTIITYIDALTTGNYGRAFSPAVGSTDTLNGLTGTPITPFIAGQTGTNGNKIARFETDGVGAWILLGQGTLDQVQDGADARQSFRLSAALQAVGTPGLFTAGPGGSFSYVPTLLTGDTPDPGVLIDATDSGTFTKRELTPVDLAPVEDTIGTAGNNISATSHIVPITGTVDTVRIAGDLSNPLQIKFPPANVYESGKTITLLDASGTVNSNNPLNIVAATGSGDTFNLQTQVVYEETNGRRVFTSDGANNWSYAVGKASIMPYTVITGPSITLTANANAVKQNAHLNLVSGVNSLAILQPFDGMDVELTIVQPSTGDGTLNLPTGSRVAGNGLGRVTLTAANGAIDKLRGSYDGPLSAMLWNVPVTQFTTDAPPTAPSALSASSPTSTTITLGWTDNSSNETGFEVQRSTDNIVFNQVIVTAAGATSYVDSGLSSLTLYYYKVRALGVGGASSFTSVASNTTLTGAPGAELLEWHFNGPTNNNAVSRDNASGPTGTMNITSWTTAVENSPTNPAGFLMLSGGTTPTATVTTVPNPATVTTASYQYKVTAWYTTSPTATHTTVSSAPATTIANAATLDGVNYNHITWAATVPTPSYYTVYRSTATNSTHTTGALAGTGANGGSPFLANSFDDMGAAASGSIPGAVATNVYKTTSVGNLVPGVGTNQASISFWAKSTWPAADILNLSNSNMKVAGATGTKISFSFSGGGGSASGTISASTSSNGSALNNASFWHHYVVLMDNSQATYSTNDLKVYVDDNLMTLTRPSSGAGANRVGPSDFITGPFTVGSQFFSGSVDDVRVFNRILTLSEINALAPPNHAQ